MFKKNISVYILILVIAVVAIGMTACSTSDTDASASWQEQGRKYQDGNGENFVDSTPDTSSNDPVHSEEHEVQMGEYQGQGAANPQGYGGGGQGKQTEDFQGGGSNSELAQNQGNDGQGQGRGNGGQGQGNGNNGGGIGLGPLSEIEAEGLIRAIEEEFGAQAIYQSVVDTFGEVVPFNNIVKSEAQHAAALVRMAEKYGVPVPEFPSASELPTFETLEEACKAGVAAELADAQLYDELIPLTSHGEILWVYTNLRNASLDKHLPEFEACQ